MKWFITIAVVVVVLLIARLSIFTVDAAEYAFVTVLGKHTETLDGGGAGAGLHLNYPWPVRAVQRLDRRLQVLDLKPTEVLTYDPTGKSVGENLTVEAFVTWRIAGSDHVSRFIQGLGTVEQARTILGPWISGKLGGIIPQLPIDDLISTEAGKQQGKTRVDETIESLQTKLMKSLKDQVFDEFGIDLVDIRLRRFNHPVKVRQSIFQRIKSERERKAAKYQSEGRYIAETIAIAAEQSEREMLSKARADAEKMKGQADGDAMLIRNQAHSQDPEFYAFLKKMEKLQSILGDNRTVLLLSTHRPLFDLLFAPPRPDTPRPENKLSPTPEPKQKKDISGGL